MDLLISGAWVWLFAALASSVLSAQNVEMNRRAGQESFRLNMWRMGISAVFWLPLAMLQEWPQDGWFYAVAIVSGISMIIGFTIQNDLAMKHNGRVAIIHMPLKAVLVFGLWILVNEQAWAHVLNNPLNDLGIVICLVVMVVALGNFRRNDVSWSSLKAVMPVVVLYGVCDVLARMVMVPGDMGAKLIVFLFVMSCASSGFSVLLLPWRPKPELPLMTPKLLRSGGWAALGGMMNQTLFFTALVLGPSPAYVSMVALLSPVWLLLYHRWAGIKDEASPVAGTVVVVAAIMLMWLAK
ncbi:MAG: hypothetical protein EBQ80_03430 [Proteobacteria bacterium]|nr:hypothetical protein [Pseudomonadota bacterium]